MPNFDWEYGLNSHGFTLIAGIDEVGRGPLAGPVAAGAVILDSSAGHVKPWLEKIDDSKKLTSSARERAATEIRKHCQCLGIGLASPKEIDSIGISEATKLAMIRAIKKLDVHPEYLLIDHVKLVEARIPFTSLTKGDAISYSIAAASIVAKVARDKLMAEANRIYPGYHFDKNKGYGTKAHINSIKLLGPSPFHRKSFAPIKGYPDINLENY